MYVTDQNGDGTRAAAVVRLLLDHSLVSLAEVVDMGLSVIDTSVSHEGFLVRVGGLARYFVKRADPRRSGGRDLTVEAHFYQLANSLQTLRGMVPCCHLISVDATTIVLDALQAVPLAEEHLLAGVRESCDVPSPAPPILELYGRTVARVNAVQAPHLGSQPWMLRALDDRWGTYPWLPDLCRQLLLGMRAKRERQAVFREALRSWSSTGLIHGDLRSSNVLMEAEGAEARLWVIDWELACHGDGAWDVGSVLAEMVSSSAAASPDLRSAANVRGSAVAFLSGYRAVGSLSDAEWEAFIHRSVRFAGLKLVQTLIEHGHLGEEVYRSAEPLLIPWIDELLGAAPALGSELTAATKGLPSS